MSSNFWIVLSGGVSLAGIMGLATPLFDRIDRWMERLNR